MKTNLTIVPFVLEKQELLNIPKPQVVKNLLTQIETQLLKRLQSVESFKTFSGSLTVSWSKQDGES